MLVRKTKFANTGKKVERGRGEAEMVDGRDAEPFLDKLLSNLRIYEHDKLRMSVSVFRYPTTEK